MPAINCTQRHYLRIPQNIKLPPVRAVRTSNILALPDRNFHDELDSNKLSCRVSKRSHTSPVIMVSKITMLPAVFRLFAQVPWFLLRTLLLMLPTYHCQHRNIAEAAVAAKRAPDKGGRSSRSSCTQESLQHWKHEHNNSRSNSESMWPRPASGEDHRDCQARADNLE